MSITLDASGFISLPLKRSIAERTERAAFLDTMNLKPQTKEFLFLLLAIVIGALAALGTMGFLALIEVGQWVAWPEKAIL